ncbi:EboA domain-containing protein [Promicromonospora iranensis]|uniref:EboA domain-containing protein n=1 Tax=Promicromonospora iranensis TaxID=1105144 RepID=UPI0023A9DE41|nr:EboA domain-containing protein [Promicromonospora iranensis]
MNADRPAASAVRGRLPNDLPTDLAGSDWLTDARAEVARDPDSITRAFAFAARRVGRAPRRPDTDPAGVVHGTVDDAARAALVVSLADAVGTGPDCAERLVALYRQGDAAERRGVLRGLDALAERGSLGGPAADADAGSDAGTGSDASALVAAGLELAADALRTNDPSLVAAAVGPFGARHLDQHTWRHAILKLVFQEVSLEAASGLADRADDELDRMARDFAAERQAAGRPVPTDLGLLTNGPLANTRLGTTPSTPKE